MQFSHGHTIIRIEHDSDCHTCDPRTDYPNVGTMVCFHSRYCLGDVNPKGSPDEYLLQLMQEREYRLHGKDVPDSIKPEDMQTYINKHYIMLPLYLYDHSGLSMSVDPFGCPWDSGQVGFIYMDRDSVEYDDPIAGLTAEVETYNQWLNGDIYGYIIEDSEGNVLDSCWGFYGVDQCKQEAMHHAEYISANLATSFVI